MSAFEWYASLVMTPPTPSNEPWSVLLRRGHSDWSASSGQPSYYFLWPAASGRARTECDIVLISLCWKKRMHLALKRSQYWIPQTFLCIMCALYSIFAWFSSCHFGLQYVAPISSPIVNWMAAALSAGALFFHWFILIYWKRKPWKRSHHWNQN